MPRPLCMSNLVCYALSCAELVSDILPFLLLYSAAFILLLLFFLYFCCSVFLLYRIAEYLYAGLNSQLAAV